MFTMKTAITFCPVQPYELERFLAFVSAEALFNNVIILTLPARMEIARAVEARHPELNCRVQEYPLTSQYPDYYDPYRVHELPPCFAERFGKASGVVLISGEAVPFPVMKTMCFPPIKPHYNCFKILKSLGVKETYSFSLNSMEKTRIPHLLDDFAGIHEGQRCFVVGNGPSLKSLDMTLLKNEITLGANKVYLGFKDWGFPFTYWGIVDDRQIELYPDEWETHIPRETVKFFPFEYLRVLHFKNGCPINTYHSGNFAYPHNFIDPSQKKADLYAPYMFSFTPHIVYLGWTVTYMLLQIAAIMGCNPIYLIGVDHRFKITEEDRKRGYWQNEKGENHFHPAYSANKTFNLPNETKSESFFDHAAAACRKQGIEIYNATPGTALKSFPLVAYESLFSSSSKGHKKLSRLKPPRPMNASTAVSEPRPSNGLCDSKKVTILLCSPDIRSDITRRGLDSLVQHTDPKLYKLVLADNRRDVSFSHPHELNKCLKTLDTDYLVCLDDDVVLTPGWLEALLEAAERDPSIGAVGCVHTYADGTINHSGGTFYYTNGSWRSKQSVSPIEITVSSPYVCSACVLLRKTSLYFDESYAKYRFEVDYCYRLWEMGLQVVVSPHQIHHLVNQQMLNKCGQNKEKVRAAHQLDEVVFSKIWYESGRLNALLETIRSKLTHPDIKNMGSQSNVQRAVVTRTKLHDSMLLSALVIARMKSLANTSTSGVAVMGAGKHTVWLEKILAGQCGLPDIIAVLDDQVTEGPLRFGLKTTPAGQFVPGTVNTIILSSDCHQAKMAARCRELFGPNIRLVDLYEGLPPGPYTKE